MRGACEKSWSLTQKPIREVGYLGAIDGVQDRISTLAFFGTTDIWLLVLYRGSHGEDVLSRSHFGRGEATELGLHGDMPDDNLGRSSGIFIRNMKLYYNSMNSLALKGY